MTLKEAKRALDKVITKSRVHLYKPIQVAEILYRDRTISSIDLANLETYRTKSKAWRDEISRRFLGRTCTSSCKFQDNLFEDNATPPNVLVALGNENRQKNGIVEAYIYRNLEIKHTQMSTGLAYCQNATRHDFSIKKFIDLFWLEPGLKRSVDKIYEITVFALFTAIVDELEVRVTVSLDDSKLFILDEFEDFAQKILCINKEHPTYTTPARLYRVGVTNAADRGLDMWANFGPAIQIKHLALDETLAENVVSSVSADRIVIVCKTAEVGIILSLINQLGWKSRVQSIVTEDDLVKWYEHALRGRHGVTIGDKVLKTLSNEIKNEFPTSEDEGFSSFYKERGYDKLKDKFWETF